MRANTDRSKALSFDAAADRYDAARPRFDHDLVASLLARAGVVARGARVLEIGAGTGQLTDALLALGSTVTAIEPGTTMARRLQDRCEVVNQTFEEAELPVDEFDLVASANAFHWVDPRVGHRKVAAVLRPTGRVLLLWNFPVPHDHAAQSAVAEVLAARLPDSVWDEARARDLDAVLAEGRAEIANGTALDVIDHGWHRSAWELSPFERVRLAATYAGATDVTDVQLRRLAASIEERGVSRVAMENRIYWLVAKSR